MLVPPVYRRWVTLPEERPRARLRLFCFHFAGGDASLFRLWAAGLPQSIEVCPIELPGRGRRRDEAPLTRFPELLEALGPMVRPFAERLPYALFGHSFGGIIAFELARWMRRRALRLPERLFLSACPALHVRERPTPPISGLPDHEFLEQIASRYGAPREVLQSDDVREGLLPALRADLLVAESYAYRPEPPLAVPLSSFGGERDPEVSPAEVAAWRAQTSAAFRMRLFPGDHFFLAAQRRALHQALLEDLGHPAP